MLWSIVDFSMLIGAQETLKQVFDGVIILQFPQCIIYDLFFILNKEILKLVFMGYLLFLPHPRIFKFFFDLNYD